LRIMRQMLTECLLLTGAGALIGVASAPFLGRSLRYLLPPGPLSQLISMDTRPNVAVLAFTAGVCVVCALAAGLLPALHVSRIALSTTLNAGGRSGAAGRPHNRIRSMLVASEVALAMVTLVGAGLFARGFQQSMHIDPGFDPDHVLVNQFYLSTNENGPNVMIVNQAFARRYFAGRNPIGHAVHGWGRWFRIVGVAKDSKYHYLSETTPPYFYVSFRQLYRADMNLAFYVRTRGEPLGILSALRAQTREIDPNVTVFDAAPLKEYIGASLYPQKVAASLMAIMSALALLLAAVGLYSTMAYSVAQRTQEIGVRMALGARPGRVLVMVVRQGLTLTAFGMAVGIGLAWVLARMAASISATNSAMGATQKVLQGNATDPLIYAAAIVFLGAVAALAAYFPARRAARVEPMEALRTE